MYRSVHNGSFTSLSEVYSAALPNDDILPVTTALLNAFNEFLLPSDIPAIRSYLSVVYPPMGETAKGISRALPLLGYTANVNGTLGSPSSLEPKLERMGGPKGCGRSWCSLSLTRLGLIIRPKWRLGSLRSRSQLLVCLGLVSFGGVVRPLGGFCAVLGRLGWSTGINSWRGEREGIEVGGQRSARLSPP